jgi:hypothetical protein
MAAFSVARIRGEVVVICWWSVVDCQRVLVVKGASLLAICDLRGEKTLTRMERIEIPRGARSRFPSEMTTRLDMAVSPGGWGWWLKVEWMQ